MNSKNNDSSRDGNNGQRTALGQFLNTPTIFKATFSCHGNLPPGVFAYGTNKCFCHVKLPNGQYLADHTWVMAKIWPNDLDLRPGDIVYFEGVITFYPKKHGACDYGFGEVYNPMFADDFTEAADFCYHYGCSLTGTLPTNGNTGDEIPMKW
jgi:hypothetical protein